MYSGNAKNSIEALRSDGSTPTADVGTEDETEIVARRRNDGEGPINSKANSKGSMLMHSQRVPVADEIGHDEVVIPLC